MIFLPILATQRKYLRGQERVMSFSNDFMWGVASSAYQIEGAADEDGRGSSIWDVMCTKPDAIYENHTGAVACDHYHLFKTDLALMRDLGIKSYRLSLSWPRILPNGTGNCNSDGITFYDNLIDECLANNITPVVTLFHWDYPYELYRRGGWLNAQSSGWFEDYAKLVVEHLSDRVQHWITLNEPQCFVGLGHCEGIHAPGDKLPMREVLLAGHNALLAHGKAVRVIRQYAKTTPVIGYSPVGNVRVPLTENSCDIQAAKEEMFKVVTEGLESKVWSNTWWMDPVYLGRYPDDGLRLFHHDLPAFNAADFEIISAPLDYFGVNIYHARQVRAGHDAVAQEVPIDENHSLTACGWPIVPQCLYWGPKFFYERYNKPIIITENGMSCEDSLAPDGKIHDSERIEFMTRHLQQIKRAVNDGVPLKGYFHWSFTDNFEWAHGYSQRFGLVYIDYASQQRIPKDSAQWYANVIKDNGANL